MQNPNQLARFEQAAPPHLDAAYNLARWLTRNDHDAKEIADIAGLPLGAVMSRLARARRRLQQALTPRMREEAHL